MQQILFFQDGNTLTCKFKGNNCDRSVFSTTFKKYLIEYLQERKQKEPQYFTLFFNEIVKNIYDHADGVGEMTLIEREDYFEFKIRDFGRKGPDKSTLYVNYSFGCTLISSVVSLVAQNGRRYMEEYDFKIDEGYIYSGKIRKDPY
jgi:hypothetical protein